MNWPNKPESFFQEGKGCMPSFWVGGEGRSFYIQHSENVINNPVHPVPEKLALPVPETLALVLS